MKEGVCDAGRREHVFRRSGKGGGTADVCVCVCEEVVGARVRLCTDSV